MPEMMKACPHREPVCKDCPCAREHERNACCGDPIHGCDPCKPVVELDRLSIATEALEKIHLIASRSEWEVALVITKVASEALSKIKEK